MMRNLLNLLPPEHMQSLMRAYHLRVVVVVVSVLLFILGVHLALLVPAYIYEQVAIQTREAELAELTAARISEEEKQFDARATLFAADAAYLSRLSEAPSASDALRILLGVSRPGITLQGMTFAIGKGKEPQKITLSGVASTRNTLRQYVGALKDVAGIQGAEVPISTYAQESNIRFTVTLTGTPTP